MLRFTGTIERDLTGILLGFRKNPRFFNPCPYPVELKTEQILTGCRTGKFGKIGAGSRADFLSALVYFSVVLMKVPLIKLCPLWNVKFTF